ncbi:MAG: hypothetical protein AB7O67_08175 [Vicinamibacterales bacterium]
MPNRFEVAEADLQNRETGMANGKDAATIPIAILAECGAAIRHEISDVKLPADRLLVKQLDLLLKGERPI